MLKAVLLDFDGTLVRRDILDVVCGIVGKESESERLNREFHDGLRPGLEVLTQRINFLKGVSKRQIAAKLQENTYLMPGTEELMTYLNSQGIITILNSGNILPVLEAYQKILGITHVVGSKVNMDGDCILGITQDQFSGPNFKLEGIRKILDAKGISAAETVAIGDSPADRQVFEFAAAGIAVNPKGGIEDVASFTIGGDLGEAIPVIKHIQEQP